MRLLARILLIILTIATGTIFLYSAYTKVLPIQPFEYTMVEYLHLPWLLAAIAARFFVGLEAALGGLLVIHFFGKNKWVPKMAFALLVLFSVYLAALWATAGNNLNCGCFGDAIWMSPSTSLIKNAILLLLVGLIIKFHEGFRYRWVNAVTLGLFAGTIVLPFILYAIQAGEPSWLRKDRYKADFTALYNPVKPDSTIQAAAYPAIPDIDLAKGKHIVAFLSPSCPHCRIAARKMHLMKVNNPSMPFYMVIGGTSSDLTDFWKESEAHNIPYMRLGREPFLDFTGGVFPLIIWVNDGWVEAKSTYNTLNEGDIERWMGK
jgi:hypothetical protein